MKKILSKIGILSPGFAVLALIWSIYYLAMRVTGNNLTTKDKWICGLVIVLCSGILIRSLYMKFNYKKH